MSLPLPQLLNWKGFLINFCCFSLSRHTIIVRQKAYLTNAGILDVACRKLKPKTGMTFKTAAFKVSCSPKYRDLFYNESNWPEGCELRDWYIKSDVILIVLMLTMLLIYSMATTDSVTPFGLVSYNLHSLNNGRGLLEDLCNNPNISIVAIQEHWLTPDNLHLLNSIHPDFIGHGVSAMNRRLTDQIHSSHPFGGVGLLWRRTISHCISIIDNDSEGRCIAVMIKLENCDVKLINVYFPCFSATTEYNIELGNCIGFIENVLHPQDSAVIIGDVNFACNGNNSGYFQLKAAMDRLNIANCDDRFSVANPATYVNSSLQCSSFIDHCFVSNGVKHCLFKIDIIDSATNLSDH